MDDGNTYHEQFERLREMLGGDNNHIYGYVSVNQLYARYQNAVGNPDDSDGECGTGIIDPTDFAYWPSGAQRHWGFAPPRPAADFRHEHGGVPFFLSGGLDAVAPGLIADLCSMFDDDRTVAECVVDACKELKDLVEATAPMGAGTLRGSVSAKVWGEE